MRTVSIIKLIFCSVIFFTTTVQATESVKVTNAWSPEAPSVTKVMAGYMQIHNNSDKDIKIISAKSPLFDRVEIHLTKMKNGMMSMIKQENLTIPAHKIVELKPGGLHMMLMGRKQEIKSGSTIAVTLTFDNGENINVTLNVKEARQEELHHHHHHNM